MFTLDRIGVEREGTLALGGRALGNVLLSGRDLGDMLNTTEGDLFGDKFSEEAGIVQANVMRYQTGGFELLVPEIDGVVVLPVQRSAVDPYKASHDLLEPSDVFQPGACERDAVKYWVSKPPLRLFLESGARAHDEEAVLRGWMAFGRPPRFEPTEFRYSKHGRTTEERVYGWQSGEELPTYVQHSTWGRAAPEINDLLGKFER